MHMPICSKIGSNVGRKVVTRIVGYTRMHMAICSKIGSTVGRKVVTRMMPIGSNMGSNMVQV